MTPLALTILQLIGKVGLDLALSIMEGIKSAATIDDAIAALKRASEKTAQQYLDEAKAKQ